MKKAYTKDKIQDTGILNTDQSFAGLDKNGGIILPKTASFEDAKVEVKEKGESKNSAGRLEYTYAGHAVGGADIMVTKAEPEKFPFDNTKEAGKKGEKDSIRQRKYHCDVSDHRISLCSISTDRTICFR